jgi:hypothetical protein
MEELKEYYDNDGDNYRDLDLEDDENEFGETGRYEVIFDVDSVRYYCFIDARSMDEALGNFFRNHPNVTYSMLVDHMEI